MHHDAKRSIALADSLCKELLKTLSDLQAELGDDTPAGALVRGKIFQLCGYYEDAIDSFEVALVGDSTLEEAAARLVIAELQARHPEEALDRATKLAQVNPGYELKEMTSSRMVSAMTLLGDALASNGRISDAIEAYKLAIGANPNDAFAAGRLAQAHLANGDPAEAIAQAAKIGTNPRYRSLESLLGLARQNSALLPKFSQGDMTSFLAHSLPGRPLTVGYSARVSPLVYADSAWSREIQPDLDHE